MKKQALERDFLMHNVRVRESFKKSKRSRDTQSQFCHTNKNIIVIKSKMHHSASTHAIAIFMSVIYILFVVVIITRFKETYLSENSPFTEKETEKLRGYRTLCMNKYDVDTTIIKKAKEMENIIDYIDERLVSYVICLYKNWGIINADGHIDWKVTLSMLPGVPQKVFNEIYSACNRTTGTDYERGYELFKCFLQNEVDLL